MDGEQVELLVQRFLDGELDRSGRQALLRLLGSRPEVRQRLLDDEAMLDAAATLSRPSVAADFVARTMAALPERHETVAEHRSAPRRPLRWISAAAAALLLAGTAFWAGRLSDRQPSAPAAAFSSDADPTVFVRLILVDPQARSVAVAGDFNGWDPARSPLERRDGGVWTTTLPLEAGRYHYMFLVDGDEWLADPLAAETSFDGFGDRNSVLDIEL